ncbi:MAG: hypothetical protein CM1200mP40_08790 [Gammaproteobacteria bacterium]|nr:MAG: hypothetical protein CM1200mP40_08790 [Gammaproteobacteria bacterium]
MSFEISNLFSVAGKTAIVTGGSRGIGGNDCSRVCRKWSENLYFCA